ncbi:MAG: beta-lactamase family protein [Gemmatimonadetes bacterium]|nr:beta-lactamase family protein [Gemmatimonadota bacterium]
MRRPLIALVAGNILAAPACAPDTPARAAGGWQTLASEPRAAAAADSLITNTLNEQRLLAISVAEVQDSGIVYSRVAGEVAAGIPADTGTVFRAASLGKPVFAYLVLRLADQGLIALDSPVVNYLPRPLASYEHYTALAADPRHRALTARRILSQQSGLPNWNRQGPVPLLAEPGTVFWYSGEGYMLQQLVLEELTGRSINDLVREQVFEPLGMANSSYLWEPRFDGRFSVDTLLAQHPILQRSRDRAEVAGSLLTNAADYARFLLAVLQGRGLSEAGRAALLTPQVTITSRSLFSMPGTDSAGAAKALGLAWTVGWGRMETSQGPALFHVGREDGCENYAVAFLDRGTAFVVLSATPVGHEGTFTAALVDALIGDGSQPLEWLEYR